MTIKPNIIVTDPENFGYVAADVFINALAKSGSALPLVTLPTGNTPAPLYNALLRMDGVSPFQYLQLDEYVGLNADDARLFSAWLDRDILTPLGIAHDNRILFTSDANDALAEIDRVRNVIVQSGAIDIAVLGLGLNGHIAFNEPQENPITDDIYMVALTDETRQSNAAYWGCALDAMPTHGYTLGIPLLAQAKQTILLVKGADKADILKRTLNENVSSLIPSTYLQNMPNVTIIADDAAASLL